ncbi:MAG: helix-hairpin-helix domain-containing protein [Myxococcota bacterium]
MSSTSPEPLQALAVLTLAGALAALARHPGPPPEPWSPPEPVPAEGARALRDGERLDVNRATAAELELLPRVGPAIAARIVAARPFARVDELQRVRGIGARTLEKLRPFLEVSADLGVGADAAALSGSSAR